MWKIGPNSQQDNCASATADEKVYHPFAQPDQYCAQCVQYYTVRFRHTYEKEKAKRETGKRTSSRKNEIGLGSVNSNVEQSEKLAFALFLFNSFRSFPICHDTALLPQTDGCNYCPCLWALIIDFSAGAFGGPKSGVRMAWEWIGGPESTVAHAAYTHGNEKLIVAALVKL